MLRALPGPRASLGGSGVLLNNRGLYVPWIESGPAFGTGLIVVATASLAAFLLRRRKFGVAASLAFGTAAIVLMIIAGDPILTWSIPSSESFNIEGGIALQPELVAMVLSLSLYQAAYVAETVRGGLQAVPRGQSEAATALGLSRWNRWRLVIAPQALRITIPPLATIWINTVKGSSIAAAIAYPDITSVFGGTVLNLTGQAVEVMGMVLGTYLTVGLAIGWLARSWENRLRSPAH